MENSKVSPRPEAKQEPDGKSADSKRTRLIIASILAVLVAVTGVLYIKFYIIPGPEFAVLVLSIYAVYNRKTWRFIRDWVPFIMIFVSYELLNSVVGTVSKNNIHYGPYNFDLLLFAGKDPNLALQLTLKTPVLNFTGAFFYTIYFFVPTAFAFVLWLVSYKDYWNYTIALAVLTFSSLVTFFIYPVAPPWLNTSLTTQGLTRILSSSVDKTLGVPSYKMLYDFLGPNLYAAFPSLHSALPWLVFLFSFKTWKWKALPVLAIPVGTWFSAIYLGEHYFTDVLGGIVYATVAFVVAVKLIPLLSKRISNARKP